MKASKWILAGVAGFAAGYIAAKRLPQTLTPEKALNLIKDQARDEFMITGSWINVHPEEVKRFGLPYTVYKGGLSSRLHSTLTQYDFMVDAKTGSILDISKHGEKVAATV
ncbi:Predicted small secreted protein [Fictibacillus solisalsi]|uniref:Predicted small secreted protein n=1 Tax=Fictibacillus solisalsi TaxID=459525 RepID=A0A1G9X294_9BACL|nr:PepSY domain-containing protein [Fictibacillus solisalsi]SDM90817.1 Predicted small secreted protein [Fictibacillus solisalsi]